MIIGGGSRSNWKWFSKHLMNGRDNEVVRVMEIRGLPAQNIRDAFDEMRLIASASPQCQNFFYHADLNTRADERLTDQEWDQAIDILEKNLGLSGQPRIVIEHDKKSRVHRHVVWGRIDPDTMRAIPDSHNYDIHMRTSDELEKLFGHERTGRGRGPHGRNPDNWEVFRGQKSGINPYDIKAEITELWQRTDSGQALAAALAEHGYTLAQGDRGLCIVDASGQEHSLARRIDGARKRDVDARMVDIDRTALPSVDEARKLARERIVSRRRGDDAQPSEPIPQPRDPSPKPDRGAAASEHSRAERRRMERPGESFLTRATQ